MSTSLSTLFVCATALGAFLFCVTYAVVAPFYKTEHGWNFMTFMAVVFTMVTLSMYFRVVGGRAPEWLASVTWGAAAACIWWRISILIRAQLRKPPE